MVNIVQGKKEETPQITPCLHPEAAEYFCFETTCNAIFSKTYTFYAYMILAYFSHLSVLQPALAQQEWGVTQLLARLFDQ